ncbi:MAG: SPOR domain-containing protein [Gammaproteobacteria bacterium SHHR-1]|uniref:SPOR domain-containing protein n=1 Tax=Magnetovirga frankeli TaxID=947516 RepID=UPI001292D728|nr:SPOR domain-containing protein [gamma proteobacterium SS-5]
MAQASRKKPEGPRIPGWAWFLAGVMLGAIGMGLLGSQDSRNLQQQIKDRLSAQTQPPAQQEEPNKAPKPRFDFYTVLPEMEVVVPEEEIQAPPKPEPKPKPAQKTTQPEQQARVEKAEPAQVYLLQMGSFRSFTDADRLKARLGFMGIESDIQSVTISNEQGKSTVHRVRGGPYSQAQAQALHRSLKDNQINSLMIKLKR